MTEQNKKPIRRSKKKVLKESERNLILTDIERQKIKNFLADICETYECSLADLATMTRVDNDSGLYVTSVNAFHACVVYCQRHGSHNEFLAWKQRFEDFEAMITSRLQFNPIAYINFELVYAG